MFSDIVAQTLRLLVFFGFFSFTAVFIYISGEKNEERNEILKKVFIASLVIGLTVSMLVGNFPPFMSWGFYSDPAPESTTQYAVVVVDEAGTEYDYPPAAAPPGRVYNRGEEMATGTGTAHPDKMAEFLLKQANLHRQSIKDGISIQEWIQYRGLSFGFGPDQWTQSEARQMDQLEVIRVYRTTISTFSDGLRIDSEQTELVYEYNMSDAS